MPGSRKQPQTDTMRDPLSEPRLEKNDAQRNAAERVRSEADKADLPRAEKSALWDFDTSLEDKT